MHRRFLFVRLPYFPIERFLKNQELSQQTSKPFWEEQADEPFKQTDISKGPLVLVHNGIKGTRISAVGPEAEEEGLWPDMKLADARAMLPNIDFIQHDMKADKVALAKLARWMLRYSPAVAIHGDHGFILDSQGCDHLFGGEEAMACDIVERFERMGFSARLAFADSVAACLALVFHGAKKNQILPPNHDPNLLDELPVDALRLENDTIVLLRRLGLKKIGDVRSVPRSALERRFRESKTAMRQKREAVQSVQWRLDQLCGVVPEPLFYIREPQEFRATKPCPELALEQTAVELALDELLPPLCALLEKAGQGGRRFRLIGYRADGGAGAVDVALSNPTNSPSDIKRLFAGKFDRIDCGYGIDLFVLEAIGAEKLNAGQRDMVDREQAGQTSASLASFADIVGNRFATKVVAKPFPRASHVPERAQYFVDVTVPVQWQEWQKLQPVWSPRPLRLLPRPEPAQVTAELPDSPPVQFVWRRVLRRVVRSRGPERILPEWWHDNLKTKRSASFRDYYDVEDGDGLRYWIFRSIKEEPVEVDMADSSDADAHEGAPKYMKTINWFVHGLF